MSLLSEILKKIKSGDPEYNPKTERERLLLYFKTVYPNGYNCFKNYSIEQLTDWFHDLEFYYKLPSEIMPQTKVTIHRPDGTRFYRVPSGVILDQDPNRTGIVSRYIEVTRFGPTNSLLRNPVLFNGTYYYPAKGSGLYLPLGRSLIGYNKVHILKMLDVPNSDILSVSGKDFKYFLKKDSDSMWNLIKMKDPKAQREKYWKKTCVAVKDISTTDVNCNKIFELNAQQFEYIPEALDRIIDEMVNGKCLREDMRHPRRNNNSRVNRDESSDEDTSKPKQRMLIYYGLGDTGDRMLAQIARDRSYDTLQMLREGQMSLVGNAVVGNELLHLIEPSYSQAYLMRLNPCLTPYYPIRLDKPNVNYLLDKLVSHVSLRFITDGEFDPWEHHDYYIDVVVPLR